jgi:ABC-type dipeptide/oligopeptide/nickel transport system permease component
LKGELVVENQINDEQIEQTITATQDKKEIGLPLIASGLIFVPIIIQWVSSLLHWSVSFLWLVAVLSPIAGLIAGVASLRRGKKRIGIAGMIISIIAIAAPLAVVAFYIIFFIGVMTGVISLM